MIHAGLSTNQRAALCLIGCLLPSPALAADRCEENPACKEHDDKAIRYSEDKNYDRALAEFNAAYEIEPVPRLLINIGRCLYRLDRASEALDYYARWWRADPFADALTQERVRRYQNEARALQMPPGAAPPSTGEQVAHARGSARPVAPFALLGSGAGLLAIGIGLGAAALVTSRDVASRDSPFDSSLYSRGMALNTSAIIFDIIGGSVLASGIVWTGVWFAQRNKSRRQIQSTALPMTAASDLLPKGGV